MLNVVRSLLFAALAFFRTRGQLAVEILALRHHTGKPAGRINTIVRH